MKIRYILITFIIFLSLLSLVGCKGRLSTVVTNLPEPPAKDYNRELPPGELALRKITDPAQIPDYTKAYADTEGLRDAVSRSIHYMEKPSSEKFYPYGEITHDHGLKSLRKLERLLDLKLPPEEMNRLLREKFDTYISVGCDNQGTVLFTGYYTPIFEGSPVRTEQFKYALYKTPDDLVKGADGAILGRKGTDGQIQQYPSREEIQKSSLLAGGELIWLADPFEVYIVHVQGSAKIRMPDGQIKTVGYAAHNGWEYRSIRKKMIVDGKLTENNINMKAMIDYFKIHPEEVDLYVSQNPRFVFFRYEEGEPRGSLNEPVTPFRTIATDKAIYPRGMFSFADVELDKPVGFVLDQDAGGAIRAAGRCDVYMGVGEKAGELAGKTYREGRLYYLFLKPESGQNPSEAGR